MQLGLFFEKVAPAEFLRKQGNVSFFQLLSAQMFTYSKTTGTLKIFNGDMINPILSFPSRLNMCTLRDSKAINALCAQSCLFGKKLALISHLMYKTS